jgi:hypothetical protein
VKIREKNVSLPDTVGNVSLFLVNITTAANNGENVLISGLFVVSLAERKAEMTHPSKPPPFKKY